MAKTKPNSSRLAGGKYDSAAVKEFLADLDVSEPAAETAAEPKQKLSNPKPEKRVASKKIAVVNAEEPKMPTKKKGNKPEPTGSIDSVFQDGGGTAKGMKEFQKGPKRPFPWGWVLGILALVTIAALAGFFFFNQKRQFTGEKVQLQIEAVQETASGNDLTIDVQYQNLESVDLVRAEITVEYPSGFDVTQTSQTSSSEFPNTFQIGTIKSGRAGSVSITGTIFGSVDTEQGFTATLTYRPANFSSDFQVVAAASVQITSSILELELSGPKQLAPNAQGTWTITYRNEAERDLENVQIEAIYPNGIDITEVKPEAVERSAVWRFDTIAQGDEGTISFTGTGSGDIGDTLEFIVRAGLITTTNTVDLQAEQKLLVVLINTGLTTAVTVNGISENSVVSPGETLQYAVNVSNLSEAVVNDVSVRVAVDGAALDFESLENPTKAKVEDQTLTWTKDNVLGLELLKPGQDVIVRFSVATLPTITVTADEDIDQTITATVTVSSPSLPASTETSQSTIFSTKLATTFNFTADARYYDDAGIAYGTGPIPPKVGETTTYRVTWSITNTTSDARDVTISVELPTSVFWTGQNVGREAGDIAFDATDRTITWTLNKLPAGTGGRLPTLTAFFEVSITPTVDQVGNSVVLTQTATATATDGFTERALRSTQASLTSDIPNDPIAPGAGAVVAAE